MTDPVNQDLHPARLRCGIVVRVREDACEIIRDRQLRSVPVRDAVSVAADRTGLTWSPGGHRDRARRYRGGGVAVV
jgi:hypothetical protein